MGSSPPDGRHASAVGLQLRPPAHHVSPRAVLFWTVRAVWGWLVLLAGQVVWLVLTDDHRALRWIAIVVTVVLAATHLLVMPRWRFRVHRWEATSTAVYTQAGWFNQERRVAPLSRIQTVDLERGPLEQLFRLANVTVTTASAAGPLKIRGLKRSVADALVDDLTVRTQAAGGDGT